MKTVQLGNTDLHVSRLALGGLFMATKVSGGDVAQARAAVRAAVAAGINYIDTAPGYANSEEVLGQALEGIEVPLILSTKLGGRPTPFNPRDKAALRASVQESLRLLGRERIDILMIHEPDRPGQYDWWTDMLAVEGPVLELLAELKAEGTIRYTGLGGTTTSELAHLCRSGKFDVVLTAFNYSLLWREAERDVIPSAKAAGMGIVIGSPLQQGALARRYDAELDRPGAYWLSKPRRAQFKALYALVDELGMPLPELALRWVLSNSDVHCALMGARSAAEVQANAAAVERGPLSADVLARLDQIGAMVPFRPCEEPLGIGWKLGWPEGHRGPGELR